MAEDQKTDADRAAEAARDADQKAIEAQQKAADADKTPEQRRADRAAANADDKRAAADQAQAEHAAGNAVTEPSTVGDAKVHAPVDAGMDAGAHRAQKFNNDPANPKSARAEHDDPDLKTVRLSRWSADIADTVYTWVHPEMVGDYLRAGWTRAA